ncbi:MAG TPA: BMP family protein [Roseiarcus sp.]|nr:BMP family protein [Roseiarcus sp.]
MENTSLLGRLSASVAVVSFLALSAVASAARAEDKAAILLPGSANDQSWNALGYSILKSLEPHGFKTAYSENVSDADEAEAMRDYASQGYQIVMGHSGRFVSAMEQVAPDFPKTQFIAVSGNDGKPPNVMSIDWNNAQFGCQLGLLAARMSKTHKVGGVYGLQGVPNITAQAGGFRICATKAGAQVTIIYFKDMEDAAQAKEAALSLIGQGADFITGKLNAAEAGLVQAAKEKNVYATGRGLDQTKIAPDLVLTNILEDWPGMFGSTADQVKAGKLFGNFVQYGYDTAPVTGASRQYSAGKAFNPVVPEAVVKEVEDMAAQFKTGALKIAPTENDARSGS